MNKASPSLLKGFKISLLGINLLATRKPGEASFCGGQKQRFGYKFLSNRFLPSEQPINAVDCLNDMVSHQVGFGIEQSALDRALGWSSEFFSEKIEFNETASIWF